jgi:hypothetical protein
MSLVFVSAVEDRRFPLTGHTGFLTEAPSDGRTTGVVP